MQTYSYTLAEHWLCPIINGDYTGLEDDEVPLLDAFLADQPQGIWDIVSDEGHFACDEITGLHANCFDVSLTII